MTEIILDPGKYVFAESENVDRYGARHFGFTIIPHEHEGGSPGKKVPGFEKGQLTPESSTVIWFTRPESVATAMVYLAKIYEKLVDERHGNPQLRDVPAFFPNHGVR
jgi:hypothetical protein